MSIDYHRSLRWPGGLLLLLVLLGCATTLPQDVVYAQPDSGYSLRFYGHGVDDIDRVKIPVQNDAGSLPTDIGATDFTIEFWLRGRQADNSAAAITCGENEDWIYGSVVFDRDRFAQGRKFGLSIDGSGRVVFGVTDEGRTARTVCGSANVLDDRWHHVVVQRRVADGHLTVYVDGRQDATASGPSGDLSYPDGVGVSYQGPTYCQGPNGTWGGYCRNEPYIVLGAEKHDAGASQGDPGAYPSFSGYVDELRLSNVLRYSGTFSPPGAPFTGDAQTVGLYHFDEGPAGACTGRISDSATVKGSPTHGACSYGGTRTAGPQYSAETPFAGAPAAPALTATRTPGIALPTVTPTRMPAPLRPTATATARATSQTPTRTPTPRRPTATPARTSTRTPQATAISAVSAALRFDGIDDVVSAAQINHPSTLTVEFWVRPATASMEAVVVNQATEQRGWSVELNAGVPSLWVAVSNDWRVVRHSTPLEAGKWHHVAVTYDNGAARVFVDGEPGALSTLPAGLFAEGSLSFGGVPGYSRFAGVLDDVRISQIVRYTDGFDPPALLPSPDADTLGQWAMNEGRGQRVADSSTERNAAQLGLLASADDADPTWAAGR